MRQIEVLEAVGTVLVQDRGRPGRSHLGVTPSGAADRGARTAALRAVGGAVDDAVLEIEGALTVRAGADLVVATTGASGPVTLDGDPVPVVAAVTVPRGGTLVVAAPVWGRRRYLAVRGGLDVPPVLGSRSSDVLSGLGPEPVQVGDLIAVGDPSGDGPTGEPGAGSPSSGFAALTMLDATPGPRTDWLAEPDALYATPWRVSRLGDRVGVRLEGAPLARRRTDELASEGVVTGSVQLPPSGQPVILGPDHPVTGGYPVIAVLTEHACDAAAQLRPGDTVRFRRA